MIALMIVSWISSDEPEEQQTYQEYTGEASLHLLQGDAVLYTDDLLLHRYRLLQPLENHI